MNPTPATSVGPLEFLRALWKQKACWAFLWLLASAAVLAAVWLIPPRYTSEAILTLEPARPPGRPALNWTDADLRARLEVARLKVLRRERLLELLRRSHPELLAQWKPEEAPERVQEWRTRITIRSEPGSRGRFSAVRVALEGKDGARAAAVVNSLAKALAQEFGELRADGIEATSWEKRVADARRRLAECRDALERFEQEYKGDWAQRESSLQTERSRLGSALAGVERSLSQAEQERARLQRELNQLRAAAEATPAEVPPPEPSRASGLSDTRRDLRERLAILLVRYKQDHPDVRRLRAEIAALQGPEAIGSPIGPSAEAWADKEQATFRSAASRSLEKLERTRAELAQAEQKGRELADEKQRLTQAIKAVEQDLVHAAGRRRWHADLVRDYELAHAHYRETTLAQQRERAENAGAPEKQVVRLVLLEEALAASKPARPNRSLLGLLGSLAALLPCALIAAGRELGARSVLAVLGLVDPARNSFHFDPAFSDQTPAPVNGRAAHAG